MTSCTENRRFRSGLADGLPICLGYLAVSFAFGISAVEAGLSVFETLLISMTNVTSAGQLAAVPIIASGGSLLELAASQLMINLRYSLMSASLTQRFGESVRFRDRFLIAFVNTDEVYAVVSAKDGTVGRNYLFGLMLTPYLGWSAGTLLGAAAGSILPGMLVSSLGIAIYGMFVAIVLPVAKRSRPVALCAVCAAALSCLFRYLPVLSRVPQGFVIILCAGTSAVLFALLFPIDPPQDDSVQKKREIEAEKEKEEGAA